MKSRRRHELETNVLADSIGRMIQWAKPRAAQLQIALLVVLAALLALVLWRPWARPARGQEAAWDFARAMQPDAGPGPLRAFLEAHPKAPQVPAAKLALARRLLLRIVQGGEPGPPGPQGYPVPRPLTDAQIEVDLAEARAMCEQVREGPEADRPTAELLLALITIQEGDLDAGRTMLREVAETWPDSAAAAGARAHLEALADYKPVAFSSEPLDLPEDEPEGVPGVPGVPELMGPQVVPPPAVEPPVEPVPPIDLTPEPPPTVEDEE